jgi:integrase/recombinase XerD
MSEIILRKINHRGAERIGIFFAYNVSVHKKVKELGAQWSNTKKCWYLDYSKDNYQSILAKFSEEEILIETNKALNPEPCDKKSSDIAPIDPINNEVGLLADLKPASEHNLLKKDEITNAEKGSICQ